jgi:hypothetical protein
MQRWRSAIADPIGGDGFFPAAGALYTAAQPSRAHAAAPLQHFLHAAGPASAPTMRLARALTALV